MAECADAIDKKNHIVIFSRSSFADLPQAIEIELTQNVMKLKAERERCQLFGLSHNPETLADMFREMDLTGKLDILRRDDQLRPKIKTWKEQGSTVIIVGVVDEDLYLAASTKSFLIGAGWVTQQEKVLKYAVQAATPNKMKLILDIIINQRAWFYGCSFDDPRPTRVLALCKANTYGWSVDPDEKEIAERFQAILKDGIQASATKQALMCHLMAAIAHDPEFMDVQDWAVMPSSSPEPNAVMSELKEHVRYMMYGRKPDDIFIRHTGVPKSRFDHKDDRQFPTYCQKHFTSIRVNDTYKGKLKGRVVCVLDDYLNYGNSFECVRNILVHCKVKKLIFVAIGKFLTRGETSYVQKHFSISGDVCSKEYDVELHGTVKHPIETDERARRSLVDLKPLIDALSEDT